MHRKLFLVVVLLHMWSALLAAQQTTKVVDLSNQFLNVPGTPRAVHNDSQNVWLVAWRQEGAGIVARIVRSNGALGPRKTLATGVSSADQNFDVAYDSSSQLYLLAYETPQGLQVQFLNTNLVKQGAAIAIESGVTRSIPRVVNNPGMGNFLIFWLGNSGGVNSKVLKNRSLDIVGKVLSTTRTVRTATGTSTYGSLAVSRNAKTGNFFAMFLEQGTSSSVAGLHIKQDGTLLSPKLIQFQSPTPNLRSAGQAAFDGKGSGFGFWSDNTGLKYRKLSGLGIGPLKTVLNAADVNSIQTSIAFDALYNQHYAVWVQANQIRGMTFNAISGALIKQPFQIAAAALPHARNAFCAYNPQSSTALVTWEDSTVDTTGASAAAVAAGAFRVRAAIFSAPGPQPNFSGAWSGTTSQKQVFQFSVITAGIKTMKLGYSIRGNGCSLDGTTEFSFGSPVPINGTSFSLNLSGSSTSYKIAGTFKSATAASGTLEVKSTSFCSGTVKATWSAAKK